MLCFSCLIKRCSIESRDRIYVTGYGFLSFCKNSGKNIRKKLSCICSQKRLDSAKISGTNALKTTSKRAIRKRAEATGDLIGNKITGTIARTSSQGALIKKQYKMNKLNSWRDSPVG